MTPVSIRKATIEDASLMLYFVKELARYEKAEHEVSATVEDFEKTIFNEHATTHALICEKNNEPIGFAVYFFNYSTWQGRNGLYLEDLYILPEFRSLGTGKVLFRHIAQIALDNNCGRFEWAVLDWNQPAIDFYRSCGAKPCDEWIKYRLSGKALEDFAQR